MSEKISGVILFAQPGRMSYSLRVLLKSQFPDIRIEQSENTSAILQLLLEEKPWLVMIDADLLENEGWLFWNGIRQKFACHHYVTLTHYAHQSDKVNFTGIPSLLLEGMTAANLVEKIGMFF